MTKKRIATRINTITTSTTRKGNPLDIQKTARIFGWLFIGTFITSLAAKALFVSGVGGSFSQLEFTPADFSETRVHAGAILEFLLIVTNIGTAVVLYPIVKRQSEGLALGYVTARVVESTFILVGLMSVISLVSLADAAAGATGAEAAALAAQGSSLVATYDWAFLFGPGLVVGFGNGLILGYLMYRSGLVPRRLAMFGLVGGPMLILSFGLILFGVYENGSGPSFLMALPEIIWEGSIGIYCAWKGFRSSPITKTVDIREETPKPSVAMA
jgi:hypothetical protein